MAARTHQYPYEDRFWIGINFGRDLLRKRAETEYQDPLQISLLYLCVNPEIPLHNNSAELDARQRVRKRKISFGLRVADGAKAWDTFMSLAATTRKLGVNFYHYIQDRISGANQIPQLSTIIEERAKELNLGASWEAA